ncbi:hypothetical protein G9A89_007768 [Geosiphon pyriformis]|nr:hypothetical protein G9A89_007768 [Geosiphon pyriformis]
MEGEKEDELREKEDELRELKKNLRQEKYKNENEKHWWIEDMQELEKQIEKQKEKLEEEVKELKVEKNELKVDMNELKTSKDRWELQMQKLQNTLMETTKTAKSSTETGSDFISSTSESLKRSMVEAFEQKYKDDLGVLQLFEKHIDDCAHEWETAQDLIYYALYSVLFQGSGTGKSRLLHQLAQDRFVIYLCFRANSSSGVPPATPTVRNFFLYQEENEMVYIAAFFCSCIEFLDGKSIEDWKNQQRDPEFEKKIINKANSLVTSWKEGSIELNLMDETSCANKIAEVWKKVEPHLSKIVNKKAKLVFAFDESRTLLGTLGQSKAFIHTRRALRCLPSGVFAIFADTISNLADFAPLASLDPSARLYLNKNKLFPPFYFMGRPLWGAALRSAAKLNELMKLARQKLLGGGITVYDWLNKPTLASGLAILSSRISLDVTAESRIASELVAGFMGICVHVSEDRHKLLAFYPSEPILAEAAALLMKDQNVLRKLLHFLLDALHTGYIEPGYRGELVVRLLLMIAWDHATRDRDISPHLGNLGYSKEFVSRPIRVKEFLISLFGQENYDEHIQSFPQKLADGLLAFTHFIPVTYTPNQTQLRTLFIRFAAVICKRNQAGVDLIIPVLLDWDGSSPISVDSMSYFLIQVKNWSKVYDAHWPSSATSKLSREFVYKDKTTEENQNPYLSLYLQLGAPKPELESFYIESFPAFNTKLQKKTRLEAEKAGKAKTQYCISGLGLDKILYRCLDKLSDDDISILKQLLCAWLDPLKLAKHENVKSLLRSMMPLVYEK